MKVINTTGKRKSALARAVLRPGTGNVRINSQSLEIYQPIICRMKIQEPLILAGDVSKKVDIDINVTGGGQMSQAESSRLAIGRALVEHQQSLRKIFLNYDRALIVARAARQKSYR